MFADTPTTSPASRPAITSLPQTNPGLIWRELSVADVADLSALVARIEARDNPPYRTSPEEIHAILSSNVVWHGVGAFATLGIESGRMVAFTHLTLQNQTVPELLCRGGVDPHFRRIGIGAGLVQWQTEEAERLLASHGHNAGIIVMSVDSHHLDLEEHLKLNGYRWTRSFNEMRVELRGDHQTPPLEPYLVIEPWSQQWEEPVRHKVNSLVDRPGNTTISAEDWLAGRIGFVPEWSFVAYDSRGDRPRVAGYLHASKYEQDWAALGWREGYIENLTVFQEWRQSGIAEAMIIASMEAQWRDGMERTGAGVSSETQSEAHNVYDFLGFRTVRQLRLYTKMITATSHARTVLPDTPH